MDHYQVLGVATTATTEEIRKSYLKIAKTHHPDKTSDVLKINKFKSALEAYDVLTDPGKRIRYDHDLQVKQRTTMYTAYQSYTHATAASATSPSFKRHPDYHSTTASSSSSSSFNAFEEFGSFFTKNPHRYTSTSTNFKPPPKPKKTNSAAAAAAFRAFYQKQQQDAADELRRSQEESGKSKEQKKPQEAPLPENWRKQETYQFKNQPSPVNVSPEATLEPEPEPESTHQHPQQQANFQNLTPEGEDEDDPDVVEIPDPQTQEKSQPNSSSTSSSSSIETQEEFASNSSGSLPEPNPKKVKISNSPPQPESIRPTFPPASPVNIHTSRRKVNRNPRPTVPDYSKVREIDTATGPQGSIFHGFRVVLEELEENHTNNSSATTNGGNLPKKPKYNHTDAEDINMKDEFIKITPLTQTNGNFSMSDINATLNEKPALLDRCLSGIDMSCYADTYIEEMSQSQPTCANPLDSKLWQEYTHNHESYLSKANDMKLELLTLLNKRLIKDTQYRSELLCDPKTMEDLNNKDLTIYEHLGKLQVLVCEVVAYWGKGRAYREKFGMKI